MSIVAVARFAEGANENRNVSAKGEMSTRGGNYKPMVIQIIKAASGYYASSIEIDSVLYHWSLVINANINLRTLLERGDSLGPLGGILRSREYPRSGSRSPKYGHITPERLYMYGT